MNPTTGGIDIVNGTSGNDTIVGTVDTTTTTNSSLSAGDNITGGAGADLLAVTVIGNGTTQAVSGVTMAGVETLRVINNGSDSTKTTDFSAAGWTGLTDVVVAGSLSTGNTKVSELTSIVNATMSNGKGNLEVAYAADTVVGTADVQKLTLNGQTAGTFTANGIETIAVTATGAASKDVTLASDKLKTVTVAGAADVGLVTSARTVDASTATGKVAVDVSDATADATNKASVKTGTGADTITVSQANFNANFSVDGGEGNDTLVVNSTATTSTPSVTFGTVTSVETLQLKVSGAQATGGTPVNRTLTADASKVASANAYVLENAQTHAHTAYIDENATFTLNNVGAAATVTVLAASGNINITNTTATTSKQNEGTTAVTVNLKDATGTADAVTVNLGAAAKDATVRVDAVSAQNVETINYVVQGTGTVSVANGDAAGNKTINVSGGTAGKTTTINGLDVATTINAATFAGNLNLGLGAAKHTVTGGTGDDTFTVSYANLTADDKLDGGAGTDRVALGKVGQTSSTASPVDFTSAAEALKFGGLKNVELVEISTDSNVKLSDGLLSSFSSGEIKFVAPTVADGAGASAPSVTTVDASGVLNPATKVTFDGSGSKDTDESYVYTLGNAIDSFVGGAAVDTVNVTSVAFLGASDSIDGGTGKATLVFKDATAQTNTFGATQLAGLKNIKAIDIDISTSTNAANYSFTLTDAVLANNWDATNKFTITGADGTNNVSKLTVDASGVSQQYGLVLTGGLAADTIKGGAGDDVITGGAGIDAITLSAGGSDVVVNFSGAFANRDVVTGFTAGTVGTVAGADVLRLEADLTTESETAAGAANLVELAVSGLTITSNKVVLTGTGAPFNSTNTVSVLEFKGLTSAANLDLANNGVELLKGLGEAGAGITGLTVNADAKFYIVAYDNGNAYVYHADADSTGTSDTDVAATEIQLVATLVGVEEGALVAPNFNFV